MATTSAVETIKPPPYYLANLIEAVDRRREIQARYEAHMASLAIRIDRAEWRAATANTAH